MEGGHSLQYPIGQSGEQPYADSSFDEKLKKKLLDEIKALPSALEYALANLDEAQLHTACRQGGWTIAQLAHHLADSHINAYVRCKLTITEDNPPIKPYEQDLWASTADTLVPVNISTTLLHALHIRWYALLESQSESDWRKTFYHPEQDKQIALWEILKYYAWHGRHHTAQIIQCREQHGWM